MNIRKLTDSTMAKIGLTCIVGLLVLIPMGKVKNLIQEREFRKDTAVNTVINQWGGIQSITGPVLVIPVDDTVTEIIDDKKEQRTVRHTVFLFPENLAISGTMHTETRNKGIYKTDIYTGKFALSGYFDPSGISKDSFSNPEILYSKAKLILGLGDTKGLSKGITASWNGNALDFTGVTETSESLIYGISALLDLDNNKKCDFTLSMELRGGESISFLPAGKETSVSITSDWTSPNFSGRFLPDERSLTGKGFSAKWKIYALSRNFPQTWVDNNLADSLLRESYFGVDFISPVNKYFKLHRAAKYSTLFIFIPFIALFFVEIFTRRRLHPVQYLLVGFAVTLFFLLLLALSEHLSFTLSYILSSTAAALLISVYTALSFKSVKYGAILAAVNSVLYLYLYTALASEDYALLIGSIGLFIILGFVMLLTGRINWFKI